MVSICSGCRAQLFIPSDLYGRMVQCAVCKFVYCAPREGAVQATARAVVAPAATVSKPARAGAAAAPTRPAEPIPEADFSTEDTIDVQPSVPVRAAATAARAPTADDSLELLGPVRGATAGDSLEMLGPARAARPEQFREQPVPPPPVVPGAHPNDSLELMAPESVLPRPGAGGVVEEGMAADGSDDPMLGREVGQYKLTRRLGRGAGSVVYEAEDTLLGRNVAVKMLLAAEIALGGKTAVERFVREARACGRLNHPNVVGIYSVGVHEKMPYIAMQLVSGGSALDGEGGSGSHPALMATRIAKLAARGLASAHALGIVHRDVKPANILLGDQGDVKVTDFGLARLMDSHIASLTEPGQALGTPHYMSPEQCTGDKADHRSDVYSLGATYFRLLTGRSPYGELPATQLMFKQVSERHPDPRTIRADVPGLCVRIIDKAMEKRPEARYQSMAEMADALEAVEQSLARDEAARRASSAARSNATVMGDAAIADILGEESLDLKGMALKAPEPVPAARTAASAAASQQPQESTGGDAVGAGWMDLPTTVRFKVAYPSQNHAKKALDILRADIRQVAQKLIRPPSKGGKGAVLDITLCLRLPDLLGVVKSLMYYEGKLAALDTDDPLAKDWLKKRVRQ